MHVGEETFENDVVAERSDSGMLLPVSYGPRQHGCPGCAELAYAVTGKARRLITDEVRMADVVDLAVKTLTSAVVVFLTVAQLP